MRVKSSFAILSMVFWVGWLSGCSSTAGSIDLGGEEGKQVASLVEELNEVKNNPKKLEAFFANKESQNSSKRLNQFSYYVASQPTINGSTATCKVLIEKANGTPAGDQEWTFEKIADQWKIKAAPTP